MDKNDLIEDSEDGGVDRWRRVMELIFPSLSTMRQKYNICYEKN